MVLSENENKELKNIADNLAAINKTLTENKKESVMTPIESLIKEVNSTCKPKEYTRKRHNTLFYTLIGVITILVSIYIYRVLTNTTSSFTEGLSFVAVIISLFAMTIALFDKSSSKTDLADEYFLQISKNEQECDKPYIKALVNMKCKEFHLDLVKLYETNSELFEPEALIKRLYD